MKRSSLILGACLLSSVSFGQILHGTKKTFTLDDTLRGTITPERAWWDLMRYDLSVDVDIDNKFFRGSNVISYKALSPGKVMQIDLQEPLSITSVVQGEKSLKFTKKGANAYFIELPATVSAGAEGDITVHYEGNPKVARRAPWDGGVSWAKDKLGRPFVATSCQGLGASVWWPCKDHMYDEPDKGMRISITIPDSLMNVSNGMMDSYCLYKDGKVTTVWEVINPINNYGVNINIGNYAHYTETYKGEKGPLRVDYWPLDYNLEVAKEHWKDVPRMLEAFEYWFGPYPFYEDGYKLVEAPYLGMEHQSSVTYGNQYKKGYLGRDQSGTGWGDKWDFIIIHESGHEWFANNITYKDIADMWVHEGFTAYSESLFTDYHYGKKAGEDYVIGTRKNIRNDIPIIGVYNVNHEGSGDMYSKGANMIHTIRHIIGDDEKFRQILRGMNKDFYHQTVSSADIEHYISQKAGRDLSKVFDQYLRDVRIPKLATQVKGGKVNYRWENVIDGFDMPVKVAVDGKEQYIYPSTSWKSIKGKTLVADRNFYITQ
ncbi:Peptidase M1 membrane alanine aminopeptidase [Leadbetterella byssophila DSM 17132]|uniref:Peptidase M1 membrane alanine aminopeptidase n=1 Tax=Leadbetterella byssophila (strain DSM 17132 / JCM 16389 / KACC 11308 / NBRC 106382 / 4M15) TaxID=649349 RepID=E4RUZ2_LEAB4|nr:M1 family metallopeptidase [Leadbetterella byssophila]ADQ17015.1 Peptidase M1 membrane alanine aminopeptidase [Leadbetterella byssophila DSM 17132]